MFSDIHNLWDFHNPVRSLLNDRLMHIRMIILLIMRVGGMGVWSILVLLRILIHLLVHHRCLLHIVETVQCLHLIAHMDNKPPQVVPRAITARLHTMINHLGDMAPLGMIIEWETVDMDRWGLVLDRVSRLLLVALPLIRVVLRAQDRPRVLNISVGEPQRITSGRWTTARCFQSRT